MLKLIPPVRIIRLHRALVLPNRPLHTTSITHRTLSPADKLWIAPSDADPSARDYTRDFRLMRPAKPATARMLPQICREIINANPDLSVPAAVRKVVERTGYTWSRCEGCEKTIVLPRAQGIGQVEDVPPLLVLPLPMSATGPSLAKLPRKLITGTCQDLSDLSYQFGPALSCLPPSEKSTYISTLWKRVLPLFQGAIRTSVRKAVPAVEDCETGMGETETLVHRFEVSGSTAIVFIHAELTNSSTMSLISAEVEACDYANATNGLWSPVLAILSDGFAFQYFIYNSITSPTKISASRVFPGLVLQQSPEAFSDSVRDVVQRMHYVFLCGYINGIRARIRRLRAVYGEEQANTLLETALEEAESALALAKDEGEKEGADQGAKVLEMSARHMNSVNKSLEKSE